MTNRPRFANRRPLIAICCMAVLAVVLATVGDSGAAVGPDVTVFSFTDVGSQGSSGGFVSYSIGTRSCNRGDIPLNWCDQGSGCAPGAGPEDHPVIAQNLYRLKDGRFEQIGMSWLKHGFVSTNSNTAGCTGATGGGCQGAPFGGNQLGIGCTDPYGSGLNSSRPLGRRSQVNATTGIFPFPISSPPGPYAVFDQRIKVATSDVDSTLNPGATYWAEGQYIASDDAAAGNAFNNASHRQVTVGVAPNYTLTMPISAPFHEMQPAIFSWPVQDPTVELINVDIPGPIVERYHVARKVTDLGGGNWHYEYVVHNLNSDRSARAFTVDFPAGTTITNAGFKDIEHHSGEPYSLNDWEDTVTGDVISWSTETFETDANANALRWATMFNFWFDANRPPTGIRHTLGLFKPGTPEEMVFSFGNELFSDDLESGDTSAWGFVSGGS
jgi:hypothetical protein